MFNKLKLEKLIKEYLKMPTPLSKNEVRQFETLMKAYESCENTTPKPPSNLKPPQEIIKIQSVKNLTFVVVKDVKMGDCIKEMLTNDLFIRQQQICGAEA